MFLRTVNNSNYIDLLLELNFTAIMMSNSTQCLSEHHHSEHPEVFHVLVHLVALAGKWITFFGSFVLIAGVSISVLNIILVRF